MIDPQNVEAYRRALDDAATGLERTVIGGSCADIEAYRDLTGQLAGLAKARTIFDEMISRQNEGHR